MIALARSLTVMLFAALPVVVIACDDSTNAVATADAAVADASPADATTVGPNDASTDVADAAACHDVANVADIVHSTFLPGPFPTHVGTGGELTSGKYVLSAVGYYPESSVAAVLDGGFDASRDAGADAADVSGGPPAPRYWRGTIEVDATLGTTIRRTWKTGPLPTLPAAVEHREVMSFEPVDSTTLSVHSLCSDAPIDFGIVDYTSTPTEIHLWLGDPTYRVDTYTRVN